MANCILIACSFIQVPAVFTNLIYRANEETKLRTKTRTQTKKTVLFPWRRYLKKKSKSIRMIFTASSIINQTKEQQRNVRSKSYLPKLKPEEPLLPGVMIKTLEETPFDLLGETTRSLSPRETCREDGRSTVPNSVDFLEAGRGVIVSAREEGRRSENPQTAGTTATLAIF